MTTRSTTCIALLRGINVGGRNRLPMAELRRLCTALGATDVETYIQSGNVIFSLAPGKLADFAGALREALGRSVGINVPVVTRTARELARAAASNPLLALSEDPSHLHVAFLNDVPDVAALARLAPDRSPGDTFDVRGRDIFLHCPNGLARSKLTNEYFDRTLATTSTIRNWKTVQRLVALSTGSGV